MRAGVRRWLRGWVGAAIAGAASAVSNGLSVMVVDPADFNLGDGAGNLLKAVWVSALVAAAIGAALELKKTPLPPDDGDDPIVLTDPK